MKIRAASALGLCVAASFLLSVPAAQAAMSEENYFRDQEISADLFFSSFVGKAEVTRTEVTERKPAASSKSKSDTQDPFLLQDEKLAEEDQADIERHDYLKGPFNNAAYGGGLGLNYFFDRYFGIGVEGAALWGGRVPFGTVVGTVTARYPLESAWHIAPYATAGFGGQFADGSRCIGLVGGGVEKRFTPSTGMFVDCRYVFDGVHEHAAEIRVGMRVAFGPGHDEVARPTGAAGAGGAISWGALNPFSKQL